MSSYHVHDSDGIVYIKYAADNTTVSGRPLCKQMADIALNQMNCFA